jgi:hypothetical protein
LKQLNNIPYWHIINRNPASFSSNYIKRFGLILRRVWFFKEQSMVFYLLLAAALLYFGGVFLVTMIGNVPLNNLLDAADPGKLDAEGLAALRNKFEPGWNLFHRIRTIVSFICIALVAYTDRQQHQRTHKRNKKQRIKNGAVNGLHRLEKGNIRKPRKPWNN